MEGSNEETGVNMGVGADDGVGEGTRSIVQPVVKTTRTMVNSAPLVHDICIAPAPNGLELSRPTVIGSPSPTLARHQWAFASPFSAAGRVGSSELLGGPDGGASAGYYPDDQ